MRFVLTARLIVSLTAALADDLTLKGVMLSSASIGYFEYEAKVDGDATLGLNVPVPDVDDVLNLLVVFDPAGSVGPVALPGHDEPHAAFGAVPFGPAALRSPVSYLNDLRGVEVAVTGPQPMTGRIMQAERFNETIPGVPGRSAMVVPRTRVTLMSAQSLRQFVLEDAESVQVTNPELGADIDRAADDPRRDKPDGPAYHVAQQRHRRADRTCRLWCRSRALEGDLPVGAAGEGRR